MKSFAFCMLFVLSIKAMAALDLSPLQIEGDWIVTTQATKLAFAVSPDYSHLSMVLPKQFKIVDTKASPALQKLIDEVFLKIVTSDLGKNICQHSTGGDIYKLRGIYGVSESAAQKMSSTCFLKDFRNYTKREFNREYIFIITPDENLSLSSWTSSRNKTYIFIKPEEISDETLFRIVAHEMAVKVDAKEQWGVWGSLNTSYFDKVEYRGDKAAQVLNSIRKSEIKYTFSAIRAFQVENKILQQLGYEMLEVPSPSEIYPAVQRVKTIYQVEELFSDVFSGATNSLGNFNFEESLQLLKDENVFNLDTQKSISLYDYLSEPLVGGANFSPFEGGPRPRVGNGAGSKNLPNVKKIKNPSSIKEINFAEIMKAKLQKVEDEQPKK